MGTATGYISNVLLQIESELQLMALWEHESPPTTALASTIPFCFDTLAFHQWLQWVFLPRMREVVAGTRPWPASSDIFPIAEHSFAGKGLDAVRLLDRIKAFDAAVTARGSMLSKRGGDGARN